MEARKEYMELFAKRKWKLAFDAMPLNIPRAISADSYGDLLTMRTRASEFTKESATKKVSVSLDPDNKQAIVTVTKK